jgi:alpha-L-fucosidase
MGDWMKVNGEAIYATKAGPFQSLVWGRCTKKQSGDNTVLYLSVFNWPEDGQLLLPGIQNKIVKAELLADNRVCKTENTKQGILMHLSGKTPDKIAAVIRLTVRGKVEGTIDDIGKLKTGALD